MLPEAKPALWVMSKPGQRQSELAVAGAKFAMAPVAPVDTFTETAPGQTMDTFDGAGVLYCKV